MKMACLKTRGPKSLLIVLSCGVLLSACQVKKNLDEMHNATVEMNQTTQNMNQNTTQLKTATDELYNALRQGDSLAARRSSLDNLTKTANPAKKLSEAAKYFMSFEFQLWNNEGQDFGDHRRETLAKDAALEFFKDVQQFIPDMKLKPQPLAGQILSTEDGNLIHSLNALAVTMHYLNPKQEHYLKEHPGVEPFSIYALIEKSLLAKASIESGEKSLSDYPAYMAEVLANEDVALYLLEARYNYLAALFLGRSTSIAHNKLSAVRALTTDWTLDLSPFNVARTEEIKLFISGALKAKALLNKVGASPRLDPIIKRILKNMNVVSTQKALSPRKAVLDQEIIELTSKIREL